MKTIIKSIAAFMTVMLLAGCEAFLDTQSYTERNTGNFPGNETDAIQLITGVYSTLRIPVSNDPRASYFVTANIASDECYAGGGADDGLSHAMDFLLVNDLNAHKSLWEGYYKGIARANMAIANLDKVENEEMRNQLLGEAYFLRSFFYFELAQLFGEIPVVNSVPTNVEEASKYPGKASIEEVYGTIAAGFKKAAEIMPSNKWNACISGLRHATRWDAEALLARVYLFYTGFYSDKTGQSITELPLVDLATGELIDATVTKENVVTLLEDCIQNSGHALVADFRLQWPYTNIATKQDYEYAKNIAGSWMTDETNPESMFQIACTHLGGEGEANRINQYVGIRKRSNYEKNGFPFSQGYGVMTACPSIYEDWYNDEPNDIRRDASIWNVETEGNEYYTWGNDSQVQETGFWQKKYQAWGFLNEDFGNKFWKEFGSIPEYGGTGQKDIDRKHSPQNLQIIRFADVLLMHSELTNGKTIYNGKSGLNAVRQRAGLGDVAYSFEAIEKERRHELAFEGVRWGDMRRYGKTYCIAALLTQKGGIVRHKGGAPEPQKEYGSGWAQRYTETYGFFPIPQTEIDLAGGIMEQNAGWTGAGITFAGF